MGRLSVYELRQAIEQLPVARFCYLQKREHYTVTIRTQLHDIRLDLVSDVVDIDNVPCYKEFHFKAVRSVYDGNEYHYDWELL